MRSRIEWLARSVALLALGAALWMWQFPRSAERLSDAVARGDNTAEANLASVTKALRSARNNTLRVSLNAVPESRTRALLHAAHDAGWRVEWSADAALANAANAADTTASVSAKFVRDNALAVSAAPRTDPDGGTIIQVAAPSGSELTLSDSLGWIDSVRVRAGGTYWELPGDARAYRVESGTVDATVQQVASGDVKRVRVFGVTGWESRFLLDALESAGWQVDADFAIAPRVNVTAGAPGTVDTSRYAAVVALDSSAWSQAPSISRFVRSGGGLILFPGSARGNAFAALRAGSAGTPLAGIPGALRSDAPTDGLALTPVAALTGDAVVFSRSARSGSPVAVAARRVGAGRVMQIGFEQTWEWRMLGGDNAVLAHRDWWRSMLQRVAYSPSPAVTERWMPLPGDAAPLADLIARVGWPVDVFSDDQSTPLSTAPPRWLFVVAASALLIEWWSRRLRGAV